MISSRLALLLLLFCGSVQSAEPNLQSQEDLSHWMTYYYVNPDPNHFVEAINLMASSGWFEDKGSVPQIFGFIAGVVRANPAKLDGWMKEFEELNDAQLSIVAIGVWYAHLPESRKLVYALMERRPEIKERLRFLLTGTPMLVTSIPVEQGPWVLDANWAYFMATGSKEPILRIISALPWLDVRGQPRRLLIGGAARWSLISNSVQHQRVLAICESEIPKQPEEIAEKLREVVASAREELQKDQ